MNISEQELRTLVRDAIARNVSSSPTIATQPVHTPSPGSHASHDRLALLGGGDSEGRCLIEPSVACTHCGYCQSMGH